MPKRLFRGGSANEQLPAFVVIGTAALVAAPPSPHSTPTLRYRLVGREVALPASGSCPQGRTRIPIAAESGRRIGVAHVCVLTIRKIEDSGGRLQRIVQTVLQTDSLPAGAIVSKQTQTFVFARDPRHSTAVFRGRVVRGTGRYAHVRGTLSGGGPTTEGVADWRMTVRLQEPAASSTSPAARSAASASPSGASACQKWKSVAARRAASTRSRRPNGFARVSRTASR